MNRESRSRADHSSNAGRRRLSRRRLLATGTAAAVGGLAGCTQVANYVAEFALGELNLFNQTASRLTGSVAVTDPAGSTTLEDRFEAKPEADEEDDGEEGNDGEETENAGITYDDVFTEAGSYTVSVALDDDSAVDGETSVERTVEVADPTEEHIVVVFGADDFEGPMGAFVVETFTDIGDHIDN